MIADLAEKLFKHVEGIHEKFEVKLLFLNLVSRLIGVHEVNFYLCVFISDISCSIALFIRLTSKPATAPACEAR